jgi:hypothetical protein
MSPRWCHRALAGPTRRCAHASRQPSSRPTGSLRAEPTLSTLTPSCEYRRSTARCPCACIGTKPSRRPSYPGGAYARQRLTWKRRPAQSRCACTEASVSCVPRWGNLRKASVTTAGTVPLGWPDAPSIRPHGRAAPMASSLSSRWDGIVRRLASTPRRRDRPPNTGRTDRGASSQERNPILHWIGSGRG